MSVGLMKRSDEGPLAALSHFNNYFLSNAKTAPNGLSMTLESGKSSPSGNTGNTSEPDQRSSSGRGGMSRGSADDEEYQSSEHPGDGRHSFPAEEDDEVLSIGREGDQETMELCDTMKPEEEDCDVVEEDELRIVDHDDPEDIDDLEDKGSIFDEQSVGKSVCSSKSRHFSGDSNSSNNSSTYSLSSSTVRSACAQNNLNEVTRHQQSLLFSIANILRPDFGLGQKPPSNVLDGANPGRQQVPPPLPFHFGIHPALSGPGIPPHYFPRHAAAAAAAGLSGALSPSQFFKNVGTLSKLKSSHHHSSSGSSNPLSHGSSPIDLSTSYYGPGLTTPASPSEASHKKRRQNHCDKSNKGDTHGGSKALSHNGVPLNRSSISKTPQNAKVSPNVGHHLPPKSSRKQHSPHKTGDAGLSHKSPITSKAASVSSMAVINSSSQGGGERRGGADGLPNGVPPSNTSNNNNSSSATNNNNNDKKGKGDSTLWPAWVYCTRYSDRPSSGPRARRIRKNKEKEVDEKRPRTAFTAEQLSRLKKEFEENRYLTERRRQDLARDLRLHENQIKIWFQNKRAKLKKSNGQRGGLALQLMAQGLYNHSTIPPKDADEDSSN